MTIKESKSKSAVTRPPRVSRSHFPIVAIGASAGGLEAMIELLKYLPPDTGMAFIYVQHLSPDHKSMLTEILSKKTKMKVQEIDDMDKIKPDNVFIIPYNKGIEVTDGNIKLIPRSESSTAISIDILFSSLAHAQKERVIGIVLSGSASDGTAGIKDIKHEGGLTFAQDDTAKFTSMPRSAIAAGVVDFILSPKEIALELARLSKHPFVKPNGTKTSNEDLIENSNPDLKIILNQLYKTTGVDFGVYKMSTIKRRIIRRMLLYKITTLKQYAKLLTQKNEETDILYQDLLINVTSFFRDTVTHKYLKEHLFPKLLKRKKVGESLRIWVPACATGEEAYSIAMILLEIQESQTTSIPIQIFATDLSGSAISKARIGVYTKQDLETVSPKRVQRFFTKANGSFRVNKAIRDMCVFAQHNILSDPPFSRLDFISCCNLFIYLDIAAQKKAVNTFHYALNKDGFLMLGKSENISHSAHLFTNSYKKYKIFIRKINSGSHRLPEFSPRFAQQTASEKNIPLANRNITPKSISIDQHGLDNAIDAVLVSEFMPASVVINHQMEIVQFRGITDLFLTHPKGKATFNILKMARPEIAFELRNSISKVIKTKSRIRKTGIELKINSEVKIISLEIVPLKIDWNEPLLLILFTEQEQAEIYSHSVNSGKTNSPAKDRRILKLELELAEAHTNALSIAQEHEAFAEELQSASEEVVSSNEELQTVNEELETSKEELESANEELTTTNQELQTRNDLLNESYDYSQAIIATMHNPMIVLDKSLRVKSASKVFYEKFKVKAAETEGVMLYDLGNRQWNIPRLRELLEDILVKKSQFYDFEISHTFPHIGEKMMLLNASRIVQKTNHEELIMLVFADVTEIRKLALANAAAEKKILQEKIENDKQLKELLEVKQKQLHNIFQYAPAAIAVFEGLEHKYILANTAYEKLTNRKANDLLGKSIREVFPELKGTGIFEVIDKVFETGEPYTNPEFATMVDLNNDGVLRQGYFNFSMEPLKNDSDKIYAVVIMIYDITAQVELRKENEESEMRHAFLLKLSDALRLLSAPEQIKIKATQVLGEHLNVTRCYYAEVLKDGQHCIIDNSYSSGLGPIDGTYRLEDFGKAKVAALRRGEVIMTADVANDTSVTQEERDKNLEMQILAYINVPLVKDNKLICLLGVNQSVVRNWTALDLTIVQETAERTWAAVERAKVEEALSISEEKYRTLFTSIDQGFTLCELIRNKEGKGIDFYMLEVNPTYEQQTGISKEMVLGKAVLQALPSLDKWIETYAAVVDNQCPVEFERYFEDTDRWFAIKAYPVEKEKFAVLFSNITERKKAEAKIRESEKHLRELSTVLEQKVKQRTTQLEDKNLELQNMNKELQAFTYISSHDLQEPLRKIQTFAGRILEKENQNLSDNGKNYFRLMQQSAERMRQLIQDLLDFSRISAAERKFENTDLNIIIEEVKKEFKEVIAEKKAVIEAKGICKVHIIPFQFRQLMHNLISNALKFSNPERPPQIKISYQNIKHKKLNLEELPPQKEYCHISISDNGIGFEKEFSTKIFEVFQKLHGKEEYTGTGIGLAIVKKIVDNHNGMITATSELNKGATFNIYIPVSS